MKIYQYRISQADEHSSVVHDIRQFTDSSVVVPLRPYEVVERIAEQWWSHDYYSDAFPLKISLWDEEDTELGEWEVEFRTVPQFTAYPIS